MNLKQHIVVLPFALPCMIIGFIYAFVSVFFRVGYNNALMFLTVLNGD